MATCLEKLPCKDCGSSDSLQTYLNVEKDLGIEWYTSFCHSTCWEQKGDPYTATRAPIVVPKTEAEIKAEAEEVLLCPLFAPKKPYRSIPPEYYRSWKLRVLLSEFDGKTPNAIAFPMTKLGSLAGWKARSLKEKYFFGVGSSAGCDPFGFERAMRIKNDTLWMTEGEFDAIALDYCLALVGGGDSYPVISLTHGGGSMLLNLERIKQRVYSKYSRICLVLDDDEVGHAAEVTAKQLWPDFNIYTIAKPKGSKDANEAVEKGLALQMGDLALNYKD